MAIQFARRCVGAALGVLMATVALAEEQLPAAVGETIPHQLTLHDQTGHMRSFDGLKGEEGAVIAFVRSADWCPFCQRQLIELNAALGDIEARGFSLISVSYDSVEKLQAFAAKQNIQYTMLSDPDSESIKAFGILNTEKNEGDWGYGIPDPALYIVDEGGVIEAVLREESYRDRPSVDLLMETLAPLAE